MENMNKELQEKLQTPKCISHYYEGWIYGQAGCLFYDGHNLCVLTASYRKSDEQVISAIHYEELKECLDSENVIVCGSNLCAVFAYAQDFFLKNGSNSLFYNTDLENYWDFPFRNATYILLREWKELLSVILPFSESHNDCFQDALEYTERYLNNYLQCHLRIRQAHDIWAHLEACAQIAHHKKTVVLKTDPPHIYCAKDEFEINANNAEILSTFHNRFYYFLLTAVNNWHRGENGEILGDYYLELMGITACLASKAIRACDLRKDYDFLHSRTYREMNIPRDNLFSMDYVDFLYDWKANPYTFYERCTTFNYLHAISFNLNEDKNQIYEYYSKVILPLWRYTAKNSPDIPAIFTSDQMICSFLLVAEKKMLIYSLQSDFWATLEKPQQKALLGYTQGYFIYLRNTYHADEDLFDQALEANGLTFHDVFLGFPIPEDLNVASNWEKINLWLLNEKEVPAHYLEDFHNFHTIMNRYIRDKEKLETILAYLLRCDGHFLRLPRKLSGKSKGVLDQKAVREALVAIGIRNCSTSNISKALQALS